MDSSFSRRSCPLSSALLFPFGNLSSTPCRATNASIEPIGEDDQWHELIGERGSSVSNPSDGIELGELFSYSILVEGNDLTVTIIREGKADVAKTIDMTNSGFTNDWMYFKAGVYTQNNSGDPMDYDEVSFYELEIIH